MTINNDKCKPKIIIDETVNKLLAEYSQVYLKKVKAIEGISYKLYLPTEISRQDLTVKLDFSKRETIIEPKTSPIETALPVSGVILINHLSTKEILAEKIRAIYTRRKGCDLFDLWYLISKKVKIDNNLIEDKLKLNKRKF